MKAKIEINQLINVAYIIIIALLILLFQVSLSGFKENKICIIAESTLFSIDIHNNWYSVPAQGGVFQQIKLLTPDKIYNHFDKVENKGKYAESKSAFYYVTISQDSIIDLHVLGKASFVFSHNYRVLKLNLKNNQVEYKNSKIFKKEFFNIVNGG